MLKGIVHSKNGICLPPELAILMTPGVETTEDILAIWLHFSSVVFFLLDYFATLDVQWVKL